MSPVEPAAPAATELIESTGKSAFRSKPSWLSASRKSAPDGEQLEKTVTLQHVDEPFLWLNPFRPGTHQSMHWIDKFCFWFFSIAIFANSIQLGLSVELTSDSWRYVWKICEHIFTAVFVLEVIVKVTVLKSLKAPYFRNCWNIVDFVLAGLGVADTWVLPLALSSDDSTQLSVLRVFRLLRLTRMVKLLRTKRELHVLLEGMLDSVSSMFWVGLLLAIIIYTFAIFCITVVGDSLESETGHDYFGDIPRAMLSLFNMALLTDWSNVIWPVFEAYPAVTPVLVFFVIITSCGVLNVIIGLIVERTNAAAHRTREEDREKERKHQLDAVRELTKMMYELDTNKDEWLSLQEMAHAPDNPKFVEMLQQINLPLGFSLSDLYMILDQDGNQKVTGKEFVDGMYRFVNCNDFQRLCMNHLAIAQVKRQVMQARREMNREVAKLRQEQGDLAREMRHGFESVLQEMRSLRESRSVAGI